MDLLPRLDPAWFRGATALDRLPCGLLPQRLTPDQRAHLAATWMFAVRGACAAGVRLALRTDAPWLRVRLGLGRRCRPWAGVAVRCDGAVVAAERPEAPGDNVTLNADLGMGFGLRTVEVLLPHTVETVLLGLEIPDGQRAETVPRPARRLLALGDSITQGMCARASENAWVVRLADALGCDLLNQGVGGALFDPAFITRDLAFTPDLVTVAYGTNDWSRGLAPAAVAETCAAVLQRVREAHHQARIIVITPLWRADEAAPPAGRAPLGEVRAAIARVARAQGCTVVDGALLVPALTGLYEDGVHPNDQGFAAMLGALRAELADSLIV